MSLSAYRVDMQPRMEEREAVQGEEEEEEGSLEQVAVDWLGAGRPQAPIAQLVVRRFRPRWEWA